MRRKVLALFWYAAFVALALLAWKVRTPYAQRFDGYEAGLVLIGAAVLARLLPRPRGFLRIGALAVISLHALREEIVFQRARTAVNESQPAQLARLGRHVIVGFDEIKEVEELARRGAIGGVFVTHKNVRGKTVAEARAMIDRIRRAALHQPFFVAADQEGGGVSRLSPPLPYRPPLGSFVDASEEEIHLHAYRQATELASLGVDVNLSPVVDLKEDRGFDPLDFHSKISDRAISWDPAQVTRVASIYVRGLERAGVIATLKHFPGLGRAGGDTHHFNVAIDAPLEELEELDFRPFHDLAATTHAFLMLGHVVVPALDREHVVTQSNAVISGLIRERWGHQGVLITDDVCMGPFYSAPGGLGRSSVRALNAGVDLLLVGYDERQYYRVMAALLEADDAGELDRRKREASIVRLNRTAEFRSFIRASTMERGNSGA
jgi:beta-N-acetylhexosaminidase